VRLFKSKQFARFCRREKIEDAALRVAVLELADGLVEANLGGGVYKKRLAREGQGKRGGYRVILFYRKDDRTIFQFGFAKSETDNVGDDALRNLKAAARLILSKHDNDLDKLVNGGTLVEITDE
jgi:hypothetical protein